MATTYCINCGAKRRANHTRSRGFCKPCGAAYQATYRKTHKDQIAMKDRELHARKKQICREAKNKPCVDCARSFGYWVMDFDHRPGCKKVTEVSNMVSQGFSLLRIQAEIAKCDVVCANCHRERTYQRKLERAA